MDRKNKDKNIIRLIFERVLIPAIAIGGVWAIIPQWPYVLVIVVVGFLILVLIAGIDFIRKK